MGVLNIFGDPSTQHYHRTDVVISSMVIFCTDHRCLYSNCIVSIVKYIRPTVLYIGLLYSIVLFKK